MPVAVAVLDADLGASRMSSSLWSELFDGEEDPYAILDELAPLPSLLSSSSSSPDPPSFAFALPGNGVEVHPFFPDVKPIHAELPLKAESCKTEPIPMDEPSFSLDDWDAGMHALLELLLSHPNMVVENEIKNETEHEHEHEHDSQKPVKAEPWGPGIHALDQLLGSRPDIVADLKARIHAASSSKSPGSPTTSSSPKPPMPPVTESSVKQYKPAPWLYKEAVGSFYRSPDPFVVCEWTTSRECCQSSFSLQRYPSMAAFMEAADTHMGDHLQALFSPTADEHRVLPGRLVHCQWAGCTWKPHKPADVLKHIMLSHTLTDMVRCKLCHHPFSTNQKCNADPERHGPRHCHTDDVSVERNKTLMPRGRWVTPRAKN
jgi:hypothetical protein